jgi:hypothetical protein
LEFVATEAEVGEFVCRGGRQGREVLEERVGGADARVLDGVREGEEGKI